MKRKMITATLLALLGTAYRQVIHGNSLNKV